MEAAAAIVGEAALQGFLDALFAKLLPLLGGTLASLMLKDDVTKEIETWRVGILAIGLVLEDAEEHQQKEAVGLWLQELEHIAYQMEDIIDLFAYEARRRELELQGAPVPRSVVDSNTIAEVGRITKSLEGLKESMSAFGLRERVIRGDSGSHSKLRRYDNSHLLNEPVVFGRDEEQRKIIEWLLKEEDRSLGVIPIVGMGGLGKTTLARYVFNDDTVKQHFHKTFWVCVSQDFDLLKIMRTVLQKIALDACDLTDLSSMHEKLVEELRGKKFLLVLDDLWNEKSGDWKDLVAPFEIAARGSGSKIIVTTRSTTVADTVRTTERMGIQQLTDDECWSLLCSHANRDFEKNPIARLERIGKKIVEKCGGVPLAARIMGGLLRYKDDEETWDAILKNKLSHLKEGEDNLMLILQLSYNSLPSRVKRCFSFCAVYSEDYYFYDDKVALTWWGAGLVADEEEARHCFNEMVQRSMFLPFQNGFVMHDLMRDLAKRISKEKCCAFRESGKLTKRTRHLSYVSDDFLKVAIDLENINFLRTLLCETLYCSIQVYPTESLNTLFSKLKLVRLLALPLNISKIPDSFQHMVLLRQLNLHSAFIESLPESISCLYNLEILNLRSCLNLRSLLKRIGFLSKLAHIDIIGCEKLSELPMSIKELKELRTLTNFIVGKNEGLSISSLSEFKHLRGTLTVSALENVASWEDAKMADLQEKSIQKLIFEHSDSNSSYKGLKVMEALRPPAILKYLTICNYPHQSFPSWLCNLSFLRKLTFWNCPRLEITLPKLPSLVILKIIDCSTVDCHDDFSLKNIKVFKLSSKNNVMVCSKMFKEKVREALQNVESIGVGIYDLTNNWKIFDRDFFPDEDLMVGIYGRSDDWTIPDWDFFPDEDLMVKFLYVCRLHYGEHFPASFLHAGSLTSLTIERCDHLKILSPEQEFLPYGIEKLSLRECPNLNISMEETHNALQSIDVRGCPIVAERLSNFVHNFVSLSSLSISEFSVTVLKPLLQNAYRLQMLTQLFLRDFEEAEIFPPEEIELPPSLERLEISGFKRLKILGPLLNTSLRSITLHFCPLLESFSGERLPLSVTILEIKYCELLIRKLVAREKSFCSKIAHVESVFWRSLYGDGGGQFNPLESME